MEYRMVHSTEIPLEIDYESSPTVVYFRRNVKKIKDSEGNIFYEYEEGVQDKSEFITQLYKSKNFLEDALQELIVGDE